MKRLALLGALVALALPMPTAHAATQQVGIVSFKFANGICPQPNGSNVATIKLNDTVSWENCDTIVHNITWESGGFTNYTLPSGATRTVTFNKTGFFDYFCAEHPDKDMRGRVIVQPNATTTTKVTAPAPTTTIATIPPTTTTSTTAPSIASTTSSSAPSGTTTTTTTGDEQAIASKDGGASGGLVALLLLGVAAVVGGGFYVIQRMRAETGA